MQHPKTPDSAPALDLPFCEQLCYSMLHPAACIARPMVDTPAFPHCEKQDISEPSCSISAISEREAGITISPPSRGYQHYLDLSEIYDAISLPV